MKSSTARTLGVRSLIALVSVFGVLGSALPVAHAAAPTVAPIIVAPGEGTSLNSTPVFDWEPVEGYSKYRFQVSTSSAFATYAYNTDTYNTYGTPDKPLPVGTVYWRVAAVDGTTVGPYAEGTFERVASDAPVQQTPADAAELVYPNDPPLFSWSPVSGVKTYRLEIDDADDFISPTIVTTQNTYATLSESQTIDQTFYWRVQGSLATGINTEWSATRSYTMRWPGEPQLISPANGTQVPIEDVVFEWAPVPGASTYFIEISPNGDWANNVTHDETVRSTRYSPPPADSLNNGSYFWRVRALDGKTVPNRGPWSDEWQFQRGWADTPQLISPAHQNYNFSSLEFSWAPVDHASYYEIQISKDQGFSPGTLTTKNCYTNQTQWSPYVMHSPLTVPGLPAGCAIIEATPDWPPIGTTMYWRVRGIDAPKGILGQWSAERSFAYMLDEPTGTSPIDGSTTHAPVLRWEPVHGAAYYKVTIKNALGATVVNADSTYSFSYTPTVALPAANGPYKWSVRPVDDEGREGLVTNEVFWPTFDVQNPCPTPPGECVTPFPLFSSPEALTPLQGASSTSMPSLTWQPVEGATSYKVMYGTLGSSIESTMVASTPFPAYTHDTPLSPDTYFWYVIAYNGGSIVSVGTDSSFTVAPLPSGVNVAPTHCADVDDCQAVAETPKLDWEPVDGAGVYLVYLAYDPNFTNVIKTYRTLTTSLTPRESLLDTQAGQAYFWLVRSCSWVTTNASRCGPLNPTTYGNATAFRKKSAPIELVSPADGATVANQVTFTWKDFLETNQGLANPAGQEAKVYRFQVSTKSDFSTILQTVDVDQTTYTPHAMNYPEGPLYWRVQAIDNSGNVLTQSTPRLVTKASPAVTPTYPQDGAVVDGAPYFAWDAHSHATKYEVEVARNADTTFSAINLESKVVGATAPKVTAWAPLSGMPPGTYAWHVRRVDASGGFGSWSAPKTFVLQPEAPAALSPEPGTISKTNDALFSWTGVQNATQYQFEMSSSASFASPTTQLTTMTSWAPTKTIADGSYYWRVRAVNASGDLGPPSSSRTWIKDVNAPNTTLVAPIPSGTLGSTTAKLTFSSEPGAVFECSLDDGDWQTCASPKTYTGLKQGAHTFEVRATDAVGNIDATPASATWIVSTLALSKIVYKAKTLNGEFVQIANLTGTPVDMTGFKLMNSKRVIYKFPSYTLKGNSKVKVHTGSGTNTATDLYWKRSTQVWGNTTDTATLKRPDNTVADTCSYNSAYATYMTC